MLWILMCVTFVKSFIFAGIQRVKTEISYKRSSHSFIDRVAMKPFGRCHPWCLVCSNHLDPVKICLLFGQHDRISHKSPHNYQFAHVMFWFSGKLFFFLSLFVKHIAPWICCVYHGNHKVQSAHGLQSLHTPFYFLFCLKQGACSC